MTARVFCMADPRQRVRTREFDTADDLFAWIESDPGVTVLGVQIDDLTLGGSISQGKPAPWWRQTYEQAVEQLR